MNKFIKISYASSVQWRYTMASHLDERNVRISNGWGGSLLEDVFKLWSDNVNWHSCIHTWSISDTCNTNCPVTLDCYFVIKLTVFDKTLYKPTKFPQILTKLFQKWMFANYYMTILINKHLHFLKNDSLSMRSATKRVSLQSSSQMRFLVSFVVPSLVSTMVFEFTSGS